MRPSLCAVPGGEQIVDALQAPRRAAWAENRGRSLLASPSCDIGPGTFSLSRIDSANTQRRPLWASAAAVRPISPTFSTMVVVPVRIASSAATVTISVPSSPLRRLAGWIAKCAEFGNPKSSLKPRSRTAAMCAWQLISPGSSAFPRPS